MTLSNLGVSVLQKRKFYTIFTSRQIFCNFYPTRQEKSFSKRKTPYTQIPFPLTKTTHVRCSRSYQHKRSLQHASIPFAPSNQTLSHSRAHKLFSPREWTSSHSVPSRPFHTPSTQYHPSPFTQESSLLLRTFVRLLARLA